MERDVESVDEFISVEFRRDVWIIYIEIEVIVIFLLLTVNEWVKEIV